MKTFKRALFFSGIILFLANCSKDLENPMLNSLVPENQKLSTTDIKTVLNTDDLTGIADNTISQIFQSPSGKRSSKVDCYTVAESATGFTISFTDCILEEGAQKVNGMIIVSYDVNSDSNAFSNTYVNLSVGDATVNGTRDIVLNIAEDGTEIAFNIVSDMKINLEDGTVMEEKGTKIFTNTFDFEDFGNITISLDGSWTLKVNDDTYDVDVTMPLQLVGGCDHFGNGIMEVVKNNAKTVVDFGDGTCDDLVSLTYADGTIEEISLKDI